MRRESSGGFTLVETLIVLGITSVMFVSMASMIAGQQSKARFKSSMTDIVTQIQSQISEVSTGYYPNTPDFRCDRIGNSPVISTGSLQLGTNSDCTFLGRAIMLNTGLAADPVEYKIHTLVGLRRTLSGMEPTTLREAGTRPIHPGENPGSYQPSWPDKSTTKNLLFGTEVAWMCREQGGGACKGDVAKKIAGFAIVTSPNQQVAYNIDGTMQSGTVIPSIIPIPLANIPGNPGVSARTGVELLVRSLGNDGVPITANSTDGPIQICFKSGTNNQSGLVIIGTRNSTTSVDFTIHPNQDCV